MFSIAHILPLFRVTQSIVTTGGNQPVVIIPANPYRVELIISAVSNYSLGIYTPPYNWEITHQYPINTGNFFKLTWVDDGPLASLEWWGGPIAVGQPIQVGVTEVLWQPTVE